MSTDIQDILRAALELDASARAELIDLLIDSLTPEVEEGVEAAWAEEIARRTKELESGQAKLVPWAEVKAAARERILHNG